MVAPNNPPRRGDVYLVDLNPTRGGEIRKARPCVIVSPDQFNRHLPTLVVVPLTTGVHSYSFRIPCKFAGKNGHILLDQIRSVDRSRMLKRLGQLPAKLTTHVLETLQEIFSP
jgi:mRNA interferase MazF